MAATESQVVFSVIGYFVILTALMGSFGIAGAPGVFVPDGGTVQTAVGGDPVDLVIGTGLLCAGSAGLSFTPLAPVAIPVAIVSCGAFGVTTVGAFAAPDATVSAFQFIFAFSFMFFQIISLQLPVHILINTILVLPAGVPLVYLGIKLYRGGG